MRQQQQRSWQLVRTGAGLNPAAYSQRARTFAAAACHLGSATLLVVRDKAGVTGFVTLPDGESAGQAALQLAQAVAARAEEVPGLPDLRGTAVVGSLTAKQNSTVTRDSQVGVDPAELSTRLPVAMNDGQWIAVTFRSPSPKEVRRVRRWHEHRLGTRLPVHHASDAQAVVMTMTAGGASKDQVRSLLVQVAAALPGFDVDVRVNVASLPLAVLPWTATSLAVFAGAWAFTGQPMLANAAALLPALIAAGIAARRLPSKARRADRQLASADIAAPPRRTAPPRRPRAGTPHPVPGRRTAKPSDGGYPLAPSCFLVGPGVIMGLVAPHAGASSGAAATESRNAPGPLLERIGPMIGKAGDARAGVHLPAADLWAGLGVCGVAGGGKSLLVQSIFGWHCLERTRPSGIKGWPGARNTLIAFESKGDGAQAYQRWAKACGDESVLVETADPSSWAIDLFAVPGNAAERAAFFVNAMIYAFGEGAIQDRSFETLTAVLTAALTVTNSIANAAGLPADMSPLFYGHILLGGQGDAKAVALAARIGQAAVLAEGNVGQPALTTAGGSIAVSTAAPSTDLGLAELRLDTYFAGKTTEATRRTLFEASRNKLGQLLAAESWWSPGRPKMTWAQILTEHRSVVINTGVTVGGLLVDERLSAQMSALLLYSLRDAIMRTCSGWQSAGRAVTVFADELALVAGAGPEVVAWLRNQGRSYGVRPIFATQYPEQLAPEIRTVFLSFANFVWFAQTNASVAAEAARDLSLDGGAWTAADVAGLEPFTAVLRSTVGQHRQPAVPVKIAFWEDDLSAYGPAQGWPDVQVGGQPSAPPTFTA